MPNRLLFSIRYFSKIFDRVLKTVLVLVAFLTLIRFNLFFLSVSAWIKDSSFAEVFLAFFTGFRFDLLVYGFLLMPLLFFWYLITLTTKWSPWALRVSKAWLRLTWTQVIFLSAIDFPFFHVSGARMRAADFNKLFDGSFSEVWSAMPMMAFFIFLTVLLIIWLLGLWLLGQIRWGDWKDEYSPLKGSPLEISWRLLVPLLLVALMARGTLEEHHLRYEHSLISNDTRLNEMALNPMWTLDK